MEFNCGRIVAGSLFESSWLANNPSRYAFLPHRPVSAGSKTKMHHVKRGRFDHDEKSANTGNNADHAYQYRLA
ncbi:hypothetical protein BKA67DRAFT_545535 [Truncatella angustata]|uniref:Uncharacterized protein n=1 Tax=Truncatella angustata TaxID=152316 RepID=A0A9P8UXB5_9PEZI|nr:uncharacterized protein BKA67DRAFT_545535 [Truncatella angustata]KAH6659721.1 hypothetical protein BKA67DRAFT_545535 [Truncatella angustata]